MKIKTRAVLAVVLIVASFFAVQGAFADDIKARMKQRLPEIVSMKSQGIVGENAGGYLEFVAAKRVKADLVAAENRDREAVYSAIAAQQGVAVEIVAKRRALQIVSQAVKGEYLKNEGGTWYQK